MRMTNWGPRLKKSRGLGMDVRGSGRDEQPITHDRGKGPIPPDNIDTLADDELSSGNSPPLNLSPTKNTWESTRTR